MKIEGVFIDTKLKAEPFRVTQRDPREQAGKPTGYYMFGANVSNANAQTINFNPVPDAVYEVKIFYRQLPLTMVSGGQGPEVPIQWHDSFVSYVLWKVYRRRGREWAEMRNEAKMEWESWMQKARRYAQQHQTDHPTRVDDTAGYMFGGE